jgi:hypothetical protein
MVEVRKYSLGIGLLILVLLGACNFSTPWVDEEAVDMQSTASHETVVAKLTEIAALFTQTPASVTDEPSASPTMVPATFTPTPTTTKPPTTTPTPLPCDQAGFVADITIKDGTVLRGLYMDLGLRSGFYRGGPTEGKQRKSFVR